MLSSPLPPFFCLTLGQKAMARRSMWTQDVWTISWEIAGKGSEGTRWWRQWARSRSCPGIRGGWSKPKRANRRWGAELWCHATAVLKSFLFSLWIPAIGHSGGFLMSVHRICEESGKPVHQTHQLQGEELVEPQALPSNCLPSGKELPSRDQKTP